MTSLTEVFSLRLRSTVPVRAFERRKKSRSPRKRSRTMNGFTLISNPRVGISVLKWSRTRTTLELAGPERFIFAEITIDLPLPQTAAGIHDLPAAAPEDFLKVRGRCLYNRSATQAAVPSLHRRRIMRHQNTASTCRM